MKEREEAFTRDEHAPGQKDKSQEQVKQSSSVENVSQGEFQVQKDEEKKQAGGQ